MNQKQSDKLEHLQWALQSRARNQQCALLLLRLFSDYEKEWKAEKWSLAAQELLSVSFSLWRAAFLADKTAKRTAVFSHATEFLEKLIEDNAISYLNDRKCKEWTFNYYTRNAKASLEALHQLWPLQVPKYTSKKRAPTERWEYCQNLLDVSVKNFEERLTTSGQRKSKEPRTRI